MCLTSYSSRMIILLKFAFHEDLQVCFLQKSLPYRILYKINKSCVKTKNLKEKSKKGKTKIYEEESHVQNRMRRCEWQY